MILYYTSKWLGGSTSYFNFLRKIACASMCFLFVIITVFYSPIVSVLSSFLSRHGSGLSDLIVFNSLVVWGITLTALSSVLLTIALLAAVKAFLTVSTAVMQRIAESPKGPLFALSAITGGVAAVIKTISG